MSWHRFLINLFPYIRNTFVNFIRDIPWFLAISSFLLAFLGIYTCIRKRDWATLLIFPAMFSVTFIFLLIWHRIPFARTWIYFVPFGIIIADAGYTFLIEKVSKKNQLFIKSGTLILAAFFAGFLISNGRILKQTDTGAFPEAQVAAKYLKQLTTRNDTVLVGKPIKSIMQFYFWYNDLPININVRNPTNQGKIYVIVQNSHYKLFSITNKPVNKLYDYGDMSLYEEVDARSK
jgi:hypothetical protein